MTNDYRNTKYCPCFSDIANKKSILERDIRKSYPRAKDMHSIISKCSEEYRGKFMEVYNYKCAYCGVSMQLIPASLFEIDHFIHEKSAEFHGSKAEAGKIENLILSCKFCNRNKSSFSFPCELIEYLNPDSEKILSTFYRDEKYYIHVSEKFKNNDIVISYYKKMKMGSDIHRIDFLLMNMIGLRNKYISNVELYDKMSCAITLLLQKRNVAG